MRLGPRDLFEFNSKHGVLICRKCQYAIQKSALQSHLLRHKIYRNDRHRLLSSIALLDLFEPDNVPLPGPGSAPVDALPIISGFRCKAVGCGNLCASSKRMRRHLSDIHGLSEPPNSSSFTRPAKLQTFFRGTKLKYFEVASSPAATLAGEVSLVSDVNNDIPKVERHDERVPVVNPKTALLLSTPPRHTPTPGGAAPRSSFVDLDLRTLTYFHHFTTTTSLTLPGQAKNPRPAALYWQTDVVLQALQQGWLMSGLLGLSACHLAALADDTTAEQIHRERSVQFISGFFTGWEETKARDSVLVVAEVEGQATEAGWQIEGILRCANWSLAESKLHQEIISKLTASSQLHFIMTTIRGFVVHDSAIRPEDDQNNDDDHQKESFAQATRILRTRRLPDARRFEASPAGDNTPSEMLDRLRALPSRMAETFGKPERARDVLATLSAIAALVECCDTGFGSDEMEATWQGMVTWLIKVPDHFNNMLSCQSPAALVVLAHWAAALVKRAEHCGCWFMTGSAKIILQQIAQHLPAADNAVQSLIEGLKV